MSSLNIAEKTLNLPQELRRKFPNHLIPIYPNLEESWDKDYAVCGGFYLEKDLNQIDDEYFDEDRFWQDVESFIYFYYDTSNRPKRSDDIRIDFCYSSQELEIYRK